MDERRQDFELLRQFAQRGDQTAFAAVVRRHLDLVYAIALRKVADQGAAEEVAQNVFAALAAKAWQFAQDDSLPAWLHRTTLLEAKTWWRGELRRRRREQTAAELGTTMKTPDEQPALRALVPLLDEALLSLRQKDRTALLLRYYETQSLREVGVSLGVGEDAAQKRVAGALDQLARFFQRRGFRTATTAAAAAVLQQSTVVAPAAVAAAVVHSTLQIAPPALAGMTALLSRLAGLTKPQTALLCAAMLTAPTVWQWTELRAARLVTARAQTQADNARAQIEIFQNEIDRLQTESARVQAAIAAATRAQTRTAEAAEKLAQLKDRLRGLLSSADYRWPSDLPFVRLPKWATTNLDSRIHVFGSTGSLSTWAEELLNLGPDQKQAVESNLAQYLQDLDRLADSQAYETNTTFQVYSPKGFTTKAIAVPPLGDGAEAIMADLITNMQVVLGNEASRLVSKPVSDGDQFLGDALIHSPQVFVLGVIGAGTDKPPFTFTWDGHFGQSGSPIIPLSTELPPFLQDRFGPWLREMGVTNDIFSVPP